jgi:Flp pilus assembly protein TadD
VAEAYARYQEGVRLLAGANAHAAVVSLERARDLEPHVGSIRETLARAYYRTGRYEAAEAEFAKAVDLDPVNDYALFGLGLCRLRAGDPGGARRHLRLAVAMRPDNPDYRAALARAAADGGPRR